MTDLPRHVSDPRVRLQVFMPLQKPLHCWQSLRSDFRLGAFRSADELKNAARKRCRHRAEGFFELGIWNFELWIECITGEK
jgi:hypothetical protein